MCWRRGAFAFLSLVKIFKSDVGSGVATVSEWFCGVDTTVRVVVASWWSTVDVLDSFGEDMVSGVATVSERACGADTDVGVVGAS
jgi:hypothetical protein